MEPLIPATATSGVATVLLDFARELEAKRAPQEENRFTDVPQADDLIRTEANAFLLGVLFAQGMPAEKAWAGPYLLRQRLGHLDVGRIGAMDFEQFAALFAARPPLHRFKRQMAHYVYASARRLAREYEGDATGLWSDCPTARELQQRLLSFDGVGQKKAAMATEILARHFGVTVREPCGTDVAGDVHVRRVFYRTGLAPSGDARDAIDAARRIHPQRPGLLDLACWLVGRRWCHARWPDHDACRLGRVCPRVGM